MGNEMNELRYLDLKNALCEKIYEGIYKDGKKIPSERQLSTDYEVSRITVRKTLELMEKENLIVREVGNGTRVTLKNYGNANPLDVVALTAPSRNPFFANFIAEFQKQAWETKILMERILLRMPQTILIKKDQILLRRTTVMRATNTR